MTEKEVPEITQDEFEEWCGSHHVRGCGGKRTMCEDYCRPLAALDTQHQKNMKEHGVVYAEHYVFNR